MIPTVNVTVTMLDPTSASPLVAAPVTARLIAQDQYQNQIIPRDTISGVTDVNGVCVLPLFPNDLGEITGDYCGDGSQRHGGYQFRVKHPSTGKKIYETIARVPNAAVTLTSIAGNMCTSPGTKAGGSAVGYGDAETPSGAVNGVNAAFTLSLAPSPPDSLQLFLNGQLLSGNGVDYTLVGKTITLNVAPQAGDLLRAWYRR